jgi:D-alanyl-D-alanine carboxypeptidase (penicillin-binding protein 5/6)
MDLADLKRIADRNRSLREAGVTLLLSSAILTLFFVFAPAPAPAAPAPEATASSTPDAFAHTPITAKAAIVLDLTDGQVLYAKDADAQLPLASLTKLLTMYAAFQTLAPSSPITIPADVVGLSAPHAFSPGQVFALDDLARVTLTGSLNDGASAIAEATAEHMHETTVSLLGGAAAALGLDQTYAVNGNGLDVSATVSGGYGSARDVARLAGALAAEAPAVVAATTHATASAVSEGGTLVTVKNTDPMVDTIPGLILSKTGYTDLADGNLALVFDAGLGHPVAVVVLGSTRESRFTDGVALVDATLAHFAGVASL